MRQLFNVGKVPMFVDAVSMGIEKRRGGEEAKVLKLTLRVEPFQRQHAAAIDEGLGEDTNVLHSAFNLTTGEPKAHVERLDLSLDCPRQRMDLYASTDTADSRICFDQVKLTKFYLRTSKDSAALVGLFTVQFGPFSKEELEAATQYFRAQMAVSWLEAEPSMVFDEPDEEEADEDEIAAHRPSPMWEPTEDQPAAEVTEPDRVTPIIAKRGTRSKRQRHDPEVERARQTTAGRAKAKTATRKAARA